jgi:hypothetical protein
MIDEERVEPAILLLKRLLQRNTLLYDIIDPACLLPHW